MKRILEIAASEIGTTELPPNSNNVKYNTDYYGREVSGQYPWCMVFVWWCFTAAGTPLPYKTASCSALLKWYKLNKPGCIVKTPAPGDIVIYTFGHCGIVYSASGDTITAIEGNTSPRDSGSQSNGGGVYLRTRKTSLVTAYIRPNAEGEGKSMEIVKGSTASEKKLIKGIQKAVGAIADGEIGTQTMSDIACMLKSDCFPVTLLIYGMPVVIGRDAIPFSPRSGLKAYANTITGGFSSVGENGAVPCSILINDGVVISANACHLVDNGCPESVLYRLYDGTFGVKRVKTADELPEGVKWAVGGMGLLDNYKPAVEGFTGKFSDVLRDTDHNVLGVKNGHVYGALCKSMTATQVNAFAKKLGLELAIMGDGGSWAAMNGGESFAKINTSKVQYNAVQII